MNSRARITLVLLVMIALVVFGWVAEHVDVV
ncbi:lipopolysaccharide export system protein LptC [Actinopolyspora biskrensis]|uniref:Uncharacterized protein n=2 Tax=Actinopolyspora TaxID=1849 RepID=A0A1H1DF58_9ACTN|nr:lipopolysaccharide export system protein LptC [Actinopolyspora biskrensis]SDQ75137.1 hypothetical protein SAMN04489718_2052 [Actinopolyspora saharensis]